ncbi:hypothetical protein SRABI26_01928 [Arthrobacter sp. Bi26]|uniref:hypothetical protein n=1 Tax=Arthrobacter sp. Bi26 TaxID=2822350 RepID=UPI001D2A57F0|nr:hypothetical protein [Arthrobacter sp. Bi26]CAH0201438.1 hypothetical protein SRABI26_01928 [Arthrobacter sp. Bi26]
MPPTAPLESRTEPDRLPQYLLGFGLGALLRFDLPALFAGPTNPAWLAATVLTAPTVGIPAGIDALRRRNNSQGRPAGATALRPDRSSP